MKNWVKHACSAGAAGVLAVSNALAADVSLHDFGFNIEGTVTMAAAPASVSLAGFDLASGLGTISVTLNGAGNRYVSLFVDHEIDTGDNTYFNEFGSSSGAAAAGQTWEIDEPGFVFGNIFDNFEASALDGTNGVPVGSEDDVAMALAWNFALAAGETASISFAISDTAPASGFYLAQTDPDSQASIYLSSALTITDTGTPPLPEPATLALVGLGLAGVWRSRSRRQHAPLTAR